MKTRKRFLPRRLVALATACALAIAALMTCTAFADDAAMEGPQPLDGANTTAEPAMTLEEGASAGSSIDKESMPSTFAGGQNEFVPFALSNYNVNSEHKAMMTKVNSLRTSLGLGKLSWNADLSQAAAQRAIEIAFFFNHNRPNGDSCFSLHPDIYGENIAYIVCGKGMKTADIIFDGWKNSPGHYANMTGKGYKSVAYGHAVVDLGSSELHLWVQLFSESEGSGSIPSKDGWRDSLIPFYPDAAKSVNADPKDLIVFGDTKQPNIVIEYKESNTLLAAGANDCLLFPAGKTSWSNIIGAVKPGNSKIVTYNPKTGILTSGTQLGKTKCTATLAPAPSLSATFTVTNSPFTRLAGDSSAETAALIARQTAVDSGTGSSEFAIIARNDDFADAMSATGLAGHLKAPILLTSRTGLSDAAKTAIRDLGVKKVYIVGGPGAILPKVETSIKNMGVKTERVYGEYSWDTSLKCAEKIHALGGNPNGEVIIAMSTNFQDALSISPLAYRDSIPILLQGNGTTIPRKLTDGEFKFITQKTDGTIWVPGGPGAVPEASVEKILGKNSPHKREIVRMYGYDGYDTSLEIAKTLVDRNRASESSIVIASGAQAPRGVDALAGAALAGTNNGVILLVNANSKIEGVHTEAVDGFLVNGPAGSTFISAFKNGTAKGYILGGSYVMPYDYESKLTVALSKK